MSPDFLALLCFALIVLAGLGHHRSLPKCPNCGSARAQTDETMPHVRQCLSCGQPYQLVG